MRPDNAIVLVRRGRGWYADYQGPHSLRVMRVFGTCMIQTAFTAAAPAGRVLAEIARLHPGINVEIAAD